MQPHGLIEFVCPACKGALLVRAGGYGCPMCAREYPVIAGIPDFRLWPDPYIGIAADREKGQRLAEAARGRDFRSIVEHYYAITPEDPPDLAVHWTARALAEVPMAERFLSAMRLEGRWLLDVGCSTAALVGVAAAKGAVAVGVDVAFRWLVIGQSRLRELGREATLVCANGEALPFPEASCGAVVLRDTVEHLRDLPTGFREIARVLEPRGVFRGSANNRYAPLPDPHVRLWGVGLLPRSKQAEFVARRRPDLHRFHVVPRSPGEIALLLQSPQWTGVRVAAEELYVPHAGSRLLQTGVRTYNAALAAGAFRALAKRLGPRFEWSAVRTER